MHVLFPASLLLARPRLVFDPFLARGILVFDTVKALFALSRPTFH